MTLKNNLEKYWYIFLIIIVLTMILIQEPTTTSLVVLNLHDLNTSYELENPSNLKINITIQNNTNTRSKVLDPNTSLKINEENFEAIGEEYE